MVMKRMGLTARLVRRAFRARRAQGRFPQQAINDLPVLFANSFPKSGTHLLTQILQGFTRLGPFVESGLPPVLTFEGRSGTQRDPEWMAAEIERLLPGDIGYGHVHAYPELLPLLTAEGVAAFFIYRDPRDVVVSHVHYVTELNPKHVHHRHYVDELPNFEARLAVSIRGRPDVAHPFPDIRARFEPYMAWLEQPEIMALRCEDLLNDLDGCLAAILAFVQGRGFAYQGDPAEAVQTLKAAIDPQRSPTYRSGKASGWRGAFSLASTALFKEISGDLLVRLGYEKSQNW